MKRTLLIFFLVFTATVAYAQTSLQGKVTDPDTGEELLFATVQLFKDGAFVNGTTTDLEGNYKFSNIDPGTYAIQVDYTGYPPVKVEGIPVLDGKINNADIEMSNSGGVNLTEIVVTGFKVPLIEQDNTTSGQTVTSEEINNLPTRNVNQIASITAGATAADEGGAINIRGSRSNATDYYVDGVRVSANNVNDSDIEQLQVITGGVEARYGDVTGGIISITTKGPSAKFKVNAEMETSEGLDAFGQSLAGLSMQGPIIKKGDKSILGFRLSGRYVYQQDDGPSAVPLFRVNDSKLAELEANPVRVVNGRSFVAADFLTNDDVNSLQTRPFEDLSAYNVNARLDLRVSNAIDLSLTGFYTNSENMFTPNNPSGSTRDNWRLLNAQNNPTVFSEDSRVNLRFRHRLGGAGVADGDGSSSNLIQNASYTLQFTAERNSNRVADPRHGENYFDYGYVGKFDADFIPVYDFTFDEAGQINGAYQIDYRQVLRNYDPTTSTNPVLSNYNNPLGYNEDVIFTSDQFGQAGRPNNSTVAGGVPNLDAFAAINGQTQSIFNRSWNLNRNVGAVYNQAFNGEGNRYTFQANASFEIVPGSSDKSRHNIQLGVWYEQREGRSYNVAPFGLWQLGRQLVNVPLNAVDTTNRIVGTQDITLTAGDGETPLFQGEVPFYAPTIEDSGGQFYRRIRESLGLPLDQLINIDGLDPSQLDLSMFGADELTDAGIVNYVGTDYLGNPFNGTFDDFFAIDPVTGRQSFNVAPFRPIYAAAYLQDKFTLNKMIFRLGVRVDRYDANTRVLKDPWSLYEVIGAGNFHENFGGDQPGSIGDDYAVYTSEENGTTVQAYRNGDDWFRPDGTPVNGPQELDGIRSGLVFPKYANPAAHETADFIKSENFTVESSFKDYEVQFNVMPRLAFSFPISDDANFFAHYDVLVQRPPSNAFATALDYYYFAERTGSSTFSNPALRPERTVDYEVGFKTRVTNNSALTITAYYKELRDMIQLRTYFPVPIVNQYTTFDNQDFSTVKGFSFTYDLRRTAGFRVNANYTLQFADGTGSNAESQRGLTNRGNLRTLFPLNFDERHRVNLVVDYRISKNSNAPNILRGLGINIQGSAVSGRPYTQTEIPTELGGQGTVGALNGARQPANFVVNGQINRTFKIAGDANVNVYFRVSNLFDRRNTLGVYSVTGRPDDPGFLQSSFGRDQLAQIEAGSLPVESYLAAYSWKVLNPGLFTLPRRMFVGAQFSL